MAEKRIFTVGFYLPGDEFEFIEFDSDQSLLDADIVLYKVGFGTHVAIENYQGQPLFDHSTSIRVYQNLEHWRSEIAAATKAGKLVIVFLTKPKSYYRYTGEQRLSGTGRSQTKTNIIAPIESYSAVPNITSVEAKTGREVRLTKEGVYLDAYWKEYGNRCAYEAFIDGKFSHSLLTTKAGDKTIAAAVHAEGALLFLPPIRCDDDTFLDEEAEEDESYWTAEAEKFGKRLAATLIALANCLRAGRVITPPPAWALESSFITVQETDIHSEISKLTTKIIELRERQAALEHQLAKAGSIRSLLFEQGKPLEEAVRDALVIFGFTAKPFTDGDSEFDIIFESPEGRCLGEVEGKDNKPVNIDKFSQLERNLQEDFASVPS